MKVHGSNGFVYDPVTDATFFNALKHHHVAIPNIMTDHAIWRAIERDDAPFLATLISLYASRMHSMHLILGALPNTPTPSSKLWLDYLKKRFDDPTEQIDLLEYCDPALGPNLDTWKNPAILASLLVLLRDGSPHENHIINLILKKGWSHHDILHWVHAHH